MAYRKPVLRCVPRVAFGGGRDALRDALDWAGLSASRFWDALGRTGPDWAKSPVTTGDSVRPDSGTHWDALSRLAYTQVSASHESHAYRRGTGRTHVGCVRTQVSLGLIEAVAGGKTLRAIRA